MAPVLSLPPQVQALKGQLHALQQVNPSAQQQAMKDDWLKFYKESLAGLRRAAALRSSLHPRTTNLHKQLRVGFYVDWDPSSYASLSLHASELTHVIPEWLYLRGTNSILLNQSDPQVTALAQARGLVVMPLLSNLDGDSWQPEAVESLARANNGRQDQFLNKLLDILHSLDAGGVVIDWQQIDPIYQKDYTNLLRKLAERLHNENLQLWVCVQANQEFATFDLETLSSFVDHFLGMLHDETGETDAPGPIASQDWFEGWLHVFLGYGDPSQWIACIGTYGYDWAVNSRDAESISFIDAMARAAHADVKRARSGPPSYNPHFDYISQNVTHHVWFLDVATFINQWHASRDENIGGLAIFRLGTEDPDLWYALLTGEEESKLEPEEIQTLDLIKTGDLISNIGQGEFITVDLSQRDGNRDITQDSRGRFASKYLIFPLCPTLYHQGEGTAHEVALSFDDGPDPDWTPKILDILKKANVKAAFFITGRQAEKYPDLVLRILKEGHEVGNHTYSHPNLSLASVEQVELELNATQRLFEAISGRSTTLFRPPYNADSHPHERREIEALDRAQSLGYLTVCENIDPEDWSRPGTDVIVERVRERRSLGSVILLHDAGGNRSQTVEALPKIIRYLQDRGDEIVSLSRLVGIPRDLLMPPLNPGDSQYEGFVSNTGFHVLRAGEEFLWAFLIMGTILLFLRTLIIITLSLRYRSISPSEKLPPLSILVAAYNEERIIKATMRSILTSDYPNDIEVILIDDGSSDMTFSEAQKIALTDPRVQVFRQTNMGKAQALRHALRKATHEIAVFIDADTQLEPKSLRHLVAPFCDPKVGAVSGHARVGNLRTFLSRCQALEYTCGFNLDRRAYHVCNAITVVPGAISAARISVIEAAGGVSDDTLAEDTDLTLAIHRLHYRIVYAHEAIAWTEAPESIRALATQRFRWAFGTLQCMWKHRDLVFNLDHGWLGFLSLPGIWIFQIILVAFAPLVDTLLLISLFLGSGVAILPYFIAFISLDFVLAVSACIIEDDPWVRSLFIIPMRLIYRPLLTFVLWLAFIRATKGVWVEWGKLDRTASVTLRN